MPLTGEAKREWSKKYGAKKVWCPSCRVSRLPKNMDGKTCKSCKASELSHMAWVAA